MDETCNDEDITQDLENDGSGTFSKTQNYIDDIS